MKSLSVILLVVLLAGGMICAGCTQPVTPAPTPTPTTLPPTSPPIPPTTTILPIPTTSSLTPGPTVTVPPGFDTNIGVTTNPVRRTIFIVYNGGSGQYLLQRIDATVITPSGKVILRTADNSQGTIPTGTTFEVQGERGVNRVQVTVTINGVSYKIVDTTVAF
jgi:hypothetical protein